MMSAILGRAEGVSPQQGNKQTKRPKKETGNFCNSHGCTSPSLQMFSESSPMIEIKIGGGRASMIPCWLQDGTVNVKANACNRLLHALGGTPTFQTRSCAFGMSLHEAKGVQSLRFDWGVRA